MRLLEQPYITQPSEWQSESVRVAVRVRPSGSPSWDHYSWESLVDTAANELRVSSPGSILDRCLPMVKSAVGCSVQVQPHYNAGGIPCDS